MKKTFGLSVALLLVVVACAPSTSEPAATDPPAAPTTESPGTTSAPAVATTSSPAATTSTVDVDAALAEAKALMTQPELSDGGTLEANGAFAESTEGFTPFEDLEVLVYDDGEHLNFYIEGPGDLVRELVIEFDAQDVNGAVVSDTSFVGDLAINPPTWAAEAQNGNTVLASEFPPPTAKSGQLIVLTAQEGSGERLGVHITSSITTLQEFERISIWIYKGFEDGRYSYAHYVQLYELLLNSASDGVIVGGFLLGLLGAQPPPAAWFTIEG